MFRHADKIGRYEIRRVLGVGGMGAVYLAHDPLLERDVAVKVILEQHVGNRELLIRFNREAQILATLQHPAIMPIYDRGEEEGQHFFVMPYMSGGTLRHKLNNGPLTIGETARILSYIAPALDQAHAAGIVHRDLKPANILFNKRHQPAIADLGIAKLSEGTLITRGIIGTYPYMSPEQIQGKELHAGSDIYSLGIILFEMLTGQRPYRGQEDWKWEEKRRKWIEMHVYQPVPSVLAVKSDLPPACEGIIRQAMAKKAEDRYSTVTDLAQAVAALVRHSRTRAQNTTSEQSQNKDAQYRTIRDTTGLPPNAVTEPTSEPSRNQNTVYSSKIVGIDFGTSSSAIAVAEGGEPTIITNSAGEIFTPSVVAFTDKGQILVGRAAVSQAAINPSRTIFSIKRQLGTNWRIVVDGTTYTAVDIAALIFASLKQDAEYYLGVDINQAVLAIPADFTHLQRRAMGDAAQKAGLTVRCFVAHSTAVGLAHSRLDEVSDKDKTVAICDWGGGYFDVSIMDIGEGVAEVQAVGGGTVLDREDFDELIANYLIKKEQGPYSSNKFLNEQNQIRLKQAAEQAKIDLSQRETVNVHLPYIYGYQSDVNHLNVDLSRSELEKLIGDSVERASKLCEQALSDTGFNGEYIDEIDELLLVGHSTQIPLVRKSLAKLFGKNTRIRSYPKKTVAFGVALLAGLLNREVTDMLLLDVTPHSLGVETLGGVMTRLIEHNTTIPSRMSKLFSTMEDMQTSVEIHVLQGERIMARDNLSLGRFVLDGIAPAPRGVPQIEVTFDIDAAHFITVTAQDKASGKEIQRSIDFGIKSKWSKSAPPISETRSHQSGGVLAPARTP